MDRPENSIDLGFVDFGKDGVAKSNKSYKIVSASSSKVASVPFPEKSEFKRLNLTLNAFYNDNLPEIIGSSEGLLKLMIDTRNPQDLNGAKSKIAFATEFQVRAGNYAPSFLYRGVVRNVLFREWINLKIDLYELDSDGSKYYQKVKNVVDNVSELKVLDVLKGIPYVNLATQLFEGLIKTFGRNPDDHVWGEFPILELYPGPGGAFLRPGIYVLFQQKNKKKQCIKVDSLIFKNGEIVNNQQTVQMSNHLVFGIDIRDYK